MTEQRYQIRERPDERPSYRWAVVDTWNEDKAVATSAYSGDILRKLHSLRNRVGNGSVYSRG